MNKITDLIIDTKSGTYKSNFDLLLRNKAFDYGYMQNFKNGSTGSYFIPAEDTNFFESELKENSIFRNLAHKEDNFYHEEEVLTTTNKTLAEFIPEGETIPIYDALDDVSTIKVKSNKLAIGVRINADFIYDKNYDLKTNLYKKFAYAFSHREDMAFTIGNGITEPCGILNKTNGAIISHETSMLTYDDVVRLYFSVDKKYRENGTFMMNDETAFILRTLKDSNGNYIWNHINDTILSKKVVINNYMPNDKAIVFGDFSHYYIINKRPFSIKTLVELFAKYNQVGYIGFEFIDGVLTDRNAIKYLEIKI